MMGFDGFQVWFVAGEGLVSTKLVEMISRNFSACDIMNVTSQAQFHALRHLCGLNLAQDFPWPAQHERQSGGIEHMASLLRFVQKNAFPSIAVAPGSAVNSVERTA